MAWTVELAGKARKQLHSLDPNTQKRVLRFLRERISTDEDPRRVGHALRGELSDLWRYRVGDYRIICRIEDQRLVVLVLAFGHHSDVYG
ncbi:MAG: type II toxin-antitoxin system RelE/ParE family toxin [Acidobacteriota bacterium]